jgi:hypothetical protein
MEAELARRTAGEGGGSSQRDEYGEAPPYSDDDIPF